MADVNSYGKNGRTSVWYAAGNGHERIVRLLLQRKADANISDKNKYTPLLWAAHNGRESVARTLLEPRHNGDVDSQDDEGKHRYVMLLVAATTR